MGTEVLYDGAWVLVDLTNVGGNKFKGFISDLGVYKSEINVWVAKANKGKGLFSPHVYKNELLSLLPLESFENEKDLYIEAALLLKCENTFKGAFENETTK